MGLGYIIGAGAQGRILVEIWRAQEPGVELHFLDDDERLHDSRILGVRVDGAVETLAKTDLSDVRVVLAVGDNRQRLALAEAWDSRSAHWATLVHPAATIMPSAVIGAGSVVFPHALVNTGAHVGKHVVINSGAVVEHDAVVEDGASLSPGVSMGGRVRIGRAAFISTGVAIAPRITIGAGTLVGAGAVVVDDLPAEVLAYGVPAKVVRRLDQDDFRRVL